MDVKNQKGVSIMTRFYFDETNTSKFPSDYKAAADASRAKAVATPPATVQAPQFEYLGKKENYDIKWFNDTSNGAKPMMVGDKQKFIFYTDTCRIEDIWCSTPFEAIAKAKAACTIKRGLNSDGKKVLTGSVRICWITESGEEIPACRVTKEVRMLWKCND